MGNLRHLRQLRVRLGNRLRSGRVLLRHRLRLLRELLAHLKLLLRRRIEQMTAGVEPDKRFVYYLMGATGIVVVPKGSLIEEKVMV